MAMQLGSSEVMTLHLEGGQNALSRRIDRMKMEFHFKFAALALQLNWKM